MISSSCRPRLLVVLGQRRSDLGPLPQHVADAPEPRGVVLNEAGAAIA